MLTVSLRQYLFTMVFSREDHTMAVVEKFERNIPMTEKTAWQDEKDLTLDVPVNWQNEWVNAKGKKAVVPDENKL